MALGEQTPGPPHPRQMRDHFGLPNEGENPHGGMKEEKVRLVLDLLANFYPRPSHTTHSHLCGADSVIKRLKGQKTKFSLQTKQEQKA